MKQEDSKALERIQDALNSLETKDFTLFFFVVDCKNVPNGEMQYIYQLAKTLYDKKYNVKMIYQLENEYETHELEKLTKKNKPIDNNRIFNGVGEWLGEEYAALPHMNIMKTEWKVTPSDFLFIPEAFSSLMKQTYQYKAPCKRIVLLHNFNYVTDFIPFNDEWGSYGIKDCITTSSVQSDLIHSVFPYVKPIILPPYISNSFRKPIEPKKLIVNVVSKNTVNVNKLIKMFYWKYPVYKFITFRDLRGYPKETFAEYLREAAITVWIDDETPFGYSALEAMKSGSILIGKIPDIIPEWMKEENNIRDNGIWSYDINVIPDILSHVIGSWMQDNFPETIYNEMENTSKLYTYENWIENCEKVINTIIGDRKKEFEDVRDTITKQISE